MRVLIDIGHPAHVHLFKNLAWRLKENGHIVLFTCRDREHVVHLLKTYGFVYENFGMHYKTPIGKAWGLIKYDILMLMIALRFKPDRFVSHGSFLAAHASFLINKPHIAFEDTYSMIEVNLYKPFTEVILTGTYDHISLGRNEIRYPGYHELAYLHPNVFSADEKILHSLGVQKGEKYAIVRFVAWAAMHDIGMKGMSFENKKRLVSELSKRMKVFITSESELPEDLREYQVKIKPEEMHNALAFAHLFVGESATMATESGVLGVPAVYINNSQLGYIKDLAKHGLVFSYTESESDQELAIKKAIELASLENNMIYETRREELLFDKIDVSSFTLWLIENYPNSIDMLKQQEVSWHQFK